MPPTPTLNSPLLHCDEPLDSGRTVNISWKASTDFNICIIIMSGLYPGWKLSVECIVSGAGTSYCTPGTTGRGVQ